MWTLPFTLQIIANAINAGIMKSTPNYSDASFSIGQVMVLYLMRPRITWLLGIIVLKFYPATVYTGPEAVDIGLEAVKTGPRAVITEEVVTNGPSGGTFGFLFVEEWQSWAYSQLIAEFMLQLMTSIIETALGGVYVKRVRLLSIDLHRQRAWSVPDNLCFVYIWLFPWQFLLQAGRRNSQGQEERHLKVLGMPAPISARLDVR